MVKFIELKEGLIVVPENEAENLLLKENNGQLLNCLRERMNQLISEFNKKIPIHCSDQTKSV